MPKLVTPLTDVQPRNAKSKDKPYKLVDDAKYWRMDYRHASFRSTLAFGKYPEVSLAVKDPTGRAYNRTAHLPERKRMRQ
jgi:hypothetical protein